MQLLHVINSMLRKLGQTWEYTNFGELSDGGALNGIYNFC